MPFTERWDNKSSELSMNEYCDKFTSLPLSSYLTRTNLGQQQQCAFCRFCTTRAILIVQNLEVVTYLLQSVSSGKWKLFHFSALIMWICHSRDYYQPQPSREYFLLTAIITYDIEIFKPHKKNNQWLRHID